MMRKALTWKAEMCFGTWCSWPETFRKEVLGERLATKTLLNRCCVWPYGYYPTPLTSSSIYNIVLIVMQTRQAFLDVEPRRRISRNFVLSNSVHFLKQTTEKGLIFPTPVGSDGFSAPLTDSYSKASKPPKRYPWLVSRSTLSLRRPLRRNYRLNFFFIRFGVFIIISLNLS